MDDQGFQGEDGEQGAPWWWPWFRQVSVLLVRALCEWIRWKCRREDRRDEEERRGRESPPPTPTSTPSTPPPTSDQFRDLEAQI